MKRTFTLITALVLGSSVQADKCTSIQYKDNHIIDVRSAMYMGTLVRLPANLVSNPIVSNKELWDVEHVNGLNQLYIKPNSQTAQGKQTMIFAYGDDGLVYTIKAVRANSNSSHSCVAINPDNKHFDPDTSRKLYGFVAKHQTESKSFTEDVARYQRQLAAIRENSEKEKKEAVVSALKKYRYHIYTRYQWDEGSEFVGKNTVADVYDDGRFTYIRLANPNRGVLSVETEIGGKTAIAPVKYEDAYSMYRVVGIYPSFTMRIDDVRIDVTRTDNASHGAS
ncbi:TrbG/VirB9 family P-type conjugative transfer protein [Candidatus Sororendozoicomonas aggregata]|uniref:TrbG/VirB9 family P-type conjugative transfer protein n=1 Tax=Candidatus Sororendozoicomonas aggregata TaxID=3073239 RepID=UPI002ED61B7A